MGSVPLRPATALDGVFLFRLYVTTRDLEMSILPWPVERKESFLRSQFEARELHYSHSFTRADNLVVLFEDAPIGRLYIDRGEFEIRIIDFALLPEYRGKGIGASLIRNLQREATETSRKLTGNVDRWNRAVTFWRRLGFQLDETAPIYLPMEWHPSRIPGCNGLD